MTLTGVEQIINVKRHYHHQTITKMKGRGWAV